MTEPHNQPVQPSKEADHPDRRATVRASLDGGAVESAMQSARQLLQEQPSLMNFRFLRQLVDGLKPDEIGLKSYKIALLSSFSIEFIHDSLIALGFINGLRIEIYQPGFGLINQEIRDVKSGLYAFAPDVTILAIEGEDWFPEIYTEFMDAEPSGGSLGAVIDRCKQEIGSLVRAFRSTLTTPLLVHNFALPRLRRAGIADFRLPIGQAKLVANLNRSLDEAVADIVDAHIVDYAALVHHFGAQNWYDARMRLYAKAPIANGMLGYLSQEYMRYCRAFGGLAKKCLVVDLDNTLWGGVIGEDGIEGIQLGPNYPGSAFVEFQRVVLDLHRRGVILAIASKNNPADVDAVFLSHRFMMIRKEHVAEMEIHWNPKSDSLKRIAKRLNIGLDHMVFVDDNPAECEQVRRELPMVTVIHLPRRPELYVETLCAEGLFDVLGLSDEDRHRGQLYQQRAQAETMRSASGNIEDYYRDLDMQLSIARVDQASRARAAQLTQKTNQFNLTTVRYSEAELAGRMADPNWLAISVGVRDRFGDNGIVGIMLAHIVEDRLDVDTFLLSCRVIGRTVETAMLAFLCDTAQERGLKKICGLVVPTEKNLPARDLYKRHGFSLQSEDVSGITRWVLDMEFELVQRPAWFG
ncbi:MAG: HAD-IIIC family phosphatase [Rhodoferax sp.]|uniref:HAD-IIIC family phosphatase n=1 Tax=Rhodoferax sp. TaxID=50421 RepID=UPI00182B9648|nr:HAD-IIIC family phosphatase [Rhodoferax sp.]NMM15540.1 HAD-IIIC family phosphatase [Rhodoferax sp.]NMM21337.1 HAD-IIIC family phosphatase [Rhodoferax sp.]